MKKRVLVAVIFSVLCMTFGFTYHRSGNSLNIQFNIKDLPEDGLILISPSDSAFDVEAAMLTSDNPSDLEQYVVRAKPFCVFIKNTGTREIAGYRLKWELLKDDGKVIRGWSSTSVPGLLVGDDHPSGRIMMDGAPPIRPGKTIFVSWESAMADLLYSNKNSQAYQTEEALKKRNAIMTQLDFINREKAQSVISVTVSVDGAYFSDGTFIGPDTGNLFAETQGYIEAQSDLGQLVRQHIQQKKSSSELFYNIKSIADEPDEIFSPSPTTADYKRLLMKIQARNLLKQRDKSGDNSTIEHTQKLLGKTWAKLQKKTKRD